MAVSPPRLPVGLVHYSDSAWHAMACHGMAFHGMPWHAMACHGMPWHAMACHGNQDRYGTRTNIFGRATVVLHRKSLTVAGDWFSQRGLRGGEGIFLTVLSHYQSASASVNDLKQMFLGSNKNARQCSPGHNDAIANIFLKESKRQGNPTPGRNVCKKRN